MGPKLQPHHEPQQPATLTRERLFGLMPAEDAEELLATARGEHAPSVTMSADDFETWCVEGPDVADGVLRSRPTLTPPSDIQPRDSTMPMYEIAIDGQQHSGSFTTRADAERGIQAVQVQFPGKRVEVLERADGGDGLARYAGRDANGLPVTSVPLDAQKGSTGGGQAPGEIQRPSDGMLPGPGGAVQTENIAGQTGGPMVEGRNPDAGKSLAPGTGKSQK